ncbi:MAG: lysophospholipid acyltransferase family protein [Candidatus Neomarinimicrobiota bacterium]|nr:MAG: hypothetical protein CBE34_01370 [bacterium TMED274]RCL91448.1 MAG: 1-acyl-sn-glycerol-3-phosphate acyltransferase [bacterium]
MKKIWVYLNLFVWTFFYGLRSMFSILFSKKKSNFKYYGIQWGMMLQKTLGVKLEVLGQENLDINKDYIFTPNHASLIDIPLLFIAVNKYLVFVAKKELDRIPIFRKIIRVAGFVLVDRRNNKDAVNSLKDLKADLRKHPRSVAIFPEGTRSKDGKLQEFKKGAAIFGIETGMPIIPIAIIGSYRWWNRGLFTKNPNIITIVFGNPINTTNSSYEDRDKITMGIKDQIIKLRNG